VTATPAPRRLRVTFAILALSLSSYGILQSLVIPVLPTIQRDLRQRTVWTANVVALLFGAGLYAVSAYVPAMVQAPRTTGYVCLTVFMFLASLGSGPLVRAFGARVLVLVGSGTDAAAFVFLALLRTHPWELVLEMSGLGIGAGLLLSSVSALVVAAVPPEETGVASGMNANFRTIGGAVGVAVTATILGGAAPDQGYPGAEGFTKAFLVLAAVSTVSLLPSAVIVRRSPSSAAEAEPILPVTLDAVGG
jgi:predicted MFS family arabinose efflux permease